MGRFKRIAPKPQDSEHDCKCAYNQAAVNGNNQQINRKVKKRFHLIFPKLEKMGGFKRTTRNRVTQIANCSS